MPKEVLAETEAPENSESVSVEDEVIHVTKSIVIVPDPDVDEGKEKPVNSRVCDVANATKDHVLVRDCSVVNGSEWSVSSAQESCQWSVLAIDTWDNLGAHQICEDGVFGCTDADANNYNPLATLDDNSCVYNSSRLVMAKRKQ